MDPDAVVVTEVPCPRQGRTGKPLCAGVLVRSAGSARYHCGHCRHTFAVGEVEAIRRAMLRRPARRHPSNARQIEMFAEG